MDENPHQTVKQRAAQHLKSIGKMKKIDVPVPHEWRYVSHRGEILHKRFEGVLTSRRVDLI